MQRVLNNASTFGAQSLASLGIQSSVENTDVEWGKLTKQRNLKGGVLVPGLARLHACVFVFLRATLSSVNAS